jgi:hypothetical protein
MYCVGLLCHHFWLERLWPQMSTVNHGYLWFDSTQWLQTKNYKHDIWIYYSYRHVLMNWLVGYFIELNSMKMTCLICLWICLSFSLHLYICPSLCLTMCNFVYLCVYVNFHIFYSLHRVSILTVQAGNDMTLTTDVYSQSWVSVIWLHPLTTNRRIRKYDILILFYSNDSF